MNRKKRKTHSAQLLQSHGKIPGKGASTLSINKLRHVIASTEGCDMNCSFADGLLI